MNYLNARIRSLRSHLTLIYEDLRESLAQWKLSRFGYRVLGGIPRAPRRQSTQAQGWETPVDDRALSQRILGHVDACVTLQRYAKELDICPDVLPAFREQAREADELASAISHIPDWEESSQLSRAHWALTRYWSSAWTNGGVSDSEYRCTLKGAALFLKQRAEHAFAPTVDISELQESAPRGRTS